MSTPLHQQTDEELIAEFQGDNEAAFDLLVGRYKDPLTNFVFRFLGDWEECNDVVQETFIRLYRNKHSYKPVARFSTWLYTIATNLARTQLRRRNRWRFLSLSPRGKDDPEPVFDLPDDAARPDRSAESALMDERIQKALDSLSMKYKEVIVLRDVQDLSYEQIAEITGLNLGTDKSRINRARAQLQEMLKDIWND